MMPIPKCVPKKKRKAYEKEHKKVEKKVRGKVKNSWAVATKVAKEKYCKPKNKRKKKK